MYNTEYQKGGLSLALCIAQVENNSTSEEMQDVVAGFFSRSKKFFQDNGLNLDILRPKETTQEPLRFPSFAGWQR